MLNSHMAEDVFFLNMAEEFQKYKDILDWEKKEFKKQLLREVSTSWFFLNRSSKQYFELNEIGIFVTNLAKIII